jgi:hypothetical protein
MNTKPHELSCPNMEGEDSKNTNREERQESKHQGVRLGADQNRGYWGMGGVRT